MGKTLKELNVKPGDVVEYYPGEKYTVKEDKHLLSSNGRLEEYHHWDDAPYFTVVSRADDTCRTCGGSRVVDKYSAWEGSYPTCNATDTPTIWYDMTPEEKGALLLAKHEGKEIEHSANSFDGWVKCYPTWSDHKAYRIKPTVETVVMYGSKRFKGFGLVQGPNTKYTITFNTIDGKADPSSIKMEEL